MNFRHEANPMIRMTLPRRVSLVVSVRPRPDFPTQ
jgi:hypothetical protein